MNRTLADALTRAGYALLEAAEAVEKGSPPPDMEPLPPVTQAAPSAEFPPFPSGPAVAAPSRTTCPIHHVAWKQIPAGVSKRTGRPYDAFLACPEKGCDQKP